MEPEDIPVSSPVSSTAEGLKKHEPASVSRRWPDPPQGWRRGLRVLSVAGLVALACVGCLFAVSWVRSQAAVNVVRAHVEAIRAGKVERAYALFSQGYQAGVSLPMFRRWLRRQGRLANVQNVEFWGRSVWGETALLWGRFQDDLGHNYSVRYLLVRENGAWRIDGFHLPAESPDSPSNPTRFLYI